MANEVSMFAGEKKISMRKGAGGMVGALKQTAAESSGSDLPDGGVYISFSGKMGKYSIGQDKEDADPNECWLVNIQSFEKGWICWKGGSPVAKRLASLYGEPVDTPDPNEHGPFKASNGEGWHSAEAMMLRSVDSGKQGYYSTNTKSALRELAKITGEVARRLEEGLPCWPIIQLDKEPFTAQGQKNYKPIFNIAGWLGMKQVQKLASAGSAEEMAEMLDDLLDEAAEEEANGILDITLSALEGTDDDADGSVDDGAFDDDIEDAEIVEEGDEEGEVDEADEDEGAEEEEAPAEKPASSLRARAQAAKAGAGTARRGLRRNKA